MGFASFYPYIIHLSIEYLLTKAVNGWQCGVRPASARKCHHHHHVIWDHCHQTGRFKITNVHHRYATSRSRSTALAQHLAQVLMGFTRTTQGVPSALIHEQPPVCLKHIQDPSSCLVTSHCGEIRCLELELYNRSHGNWSAATNPCSLHRCLK